MSLGNPPSNIPAPPHIQTLLGFDFGTQRIGVAVGQVFTQTANPVTTLLVKNLQIPWPQITQLIQQWQPDAFVVGLPLNLDQTEHKVSQGARRFGNQLNGRYNLPVYWVDERLTSHAAEQMLADKGVNKGAGKASNREKRDSTYSVDSVAAQLILESWLQTCEIRKD
ncbi:MAG: Holliday junction resolvase RuvX [Gammaproteobacteria bacterium]|nr:Holliday junction resolvase RuvX [Gammaproteobacteria bacterium]MDH5802111.1 Holliday junction resolvase RuvX [Gammaproteobacteria bacterium]